MVFLFSHPIGLAFLSLYLLAVLGMAFPLLLLGIFVAGGIASYIRRLLFGDSDASSAAAGQHWGFFVATIWLTPFLVIMMPAFFLIVLADVALTVFLLSALQEIPMSWGEVFRQAPFLAGRLCRTYYWRRSFGWSDDPEFSEILNRAADVCLWDYVRQSCAMRSSFSDYVLGLLQGGTIVLFWVLVMGGSIFAAYWPLDLVSSYGVGSVQSAWWGGLVLAYVRYTAKVQNAPAYLAVALTILAVAGTLLVIYLARKVQKCAVYLAESGRLVAEPFTDRELDWLHGR